MPEAYSKGIKIGRMAFLILKSKGETHREVYGGPNYVELNNFKLYLIGVWFPKARNDWKMVFCQKKGIKLFGRM